MFGFAKPTNEVWGQFPLMLFFLKTQKNFRFAACAERTSKKKKKRTTFPHYAKILDLNSVTFLPKGQGEQDVPLSNVRAT